MERTVRVFLPVRGEPLAVLDAFLEAPVRWLPQASWRDDGVETSLRAGGLTRPVLVRAGAPWVVGATHWRSLQWDPLPADGAPPSQRLLPAFDGELGLHVLGPGRVTLILDGRYVPPGGTVGAAIDSVALGRLAQRSLERFLEEVAGRFQEPVARSAVTT